MENKKKKPSEQINESKTQGNHFIVVFCSQKLLLNLILKKKRSEFSIQINYLTYVVVVVSSSSSSSSRVSCKPLLAPANVRARN